MILDFELHEPAKSKNGQETYSLCYIHISSDMTIWGVRWDLRPRFELVEDANLIHWSGLPCPLPGDLSNPGIKPRSPAWQVGSFFFFFFFFAGGFFTI